MEGFEEKDFSKFVIIGDRLLIKPKDSQNQTKSGLYLPPGIQEKEVVHSGYVIKTGPGYAIPSMVEDDEPWKEKDAVKYIPLQAKEGDLAIYLQKSAFEIEFNNQKYILVLIREDD